MVNMNSVTIIGNLGRDPDFRATSNGTKVANLAVATTSVVGKDKKATEWHNVVLWGAHAEAARDLRKGDGVIAVGELRTRKWQDQKGEDRYTTEIVVGGFNAGIGKWLFQPSKQQSAGNSNGNPYKRYDQQKELNDEIPF
jgi:single-strand DNA-binding protein